MARITHQTLLNLKPDPNRPTRKSIGGGLYLLVKPNGSKFWRYDYKVGTRKTLALGAFPQMLLGQAIEAHEAARKLVKAGIDPVQTRQQSAPAPNKPTLLPFGQVADDWLMTRRPAEAKGLDEAEVRARFKTYARDARMVGYLKDGKETASGSSKIDLLAVDYAAHLLPLLNACNHPTRIRLSSAARKIFAYAKAQGLFPKDRPSPFADIDFSAGFAKHKVKHRPAITDPVKFGQLLRNIESFEGRIDNLTHYALKLLTLTFVRPGTIAAARWEHFNLKGAMWVVPFRRLKMATERAEAGKSEDDYIVPLSRQALALLAELHKITGESEYLFPGYGDGATISENTINFALHSMGYQDVHCAHGFRSSASTLLNKERTKEGRRRFEVELIEMQQDRLDRSTRAVYDRDDRLPERIELMQFWADKIDQLRGPKSNAPRLTMVA